MFDQDSPFFQRSKKIAEDFLHTSVIVDDQADFGDQVLTAQTPSSPPTELKEPGRKSHTSLGEDNLVEPDTEVPQETGSHYLNAQKVINSFAQRQIVCSVIKPTDEDDSWIDTVKNLALSADIVIVDWDINKDEGAKALDVLEQIARSAIKSPAQLRLFAIYTGAPTIAAIVEEIRTTLESRLQVTIDEQDDDFSLTFASTRIVIFAKPGTSNLPQEYEHREVPFEDLADRVTSEFTVMTAGLVSNAVLKSLTQIRLNTYKMLSMFSKILNAPYLTHRALLPLPEDAEDLLNSLIAKEIRGILEEGHVGVEGNLEAIKTWLDSQKEEIVIEFDLANQKILFDASEKIHSLLSKGVYKAIEDGDGFAEEISNTQRKKVLKELDKKSHTIPFTQAFGLNEVNEEFTDDKFAHITLMRSFYIKSVPKLNLGTILRNEDNNAYYLCLQPRCDCVRIRDSRAFPFLPLQIGNDNQRFDIVVFEGEAYRRLTINYKPYKLNLLVFAPKSTDTGIITAAEENSAYYFEDNSHKKYKWLGELRPEHAQRIANEFAANLSRVGLDESEWLRLWATKG